MIYLRFTQKLLAVLLFLSLLSASAAMSQTRSVPYVTPLRWSPDASKVAVPRSNGVEVWDAAAGQALYTLTGHTDSVSAVAWSPDSSMIATASSDQTVRVWLAADGSLLQTLSGHNDSVTAVTWSPDGSQIISSGLESEPSLFIWDPITGILLSAHNEGTIVTMAFSPSGAKIALSAVLAISIREGRILEPIAQSPRVMCCANQMYALDWSPDGNTLITGSINGLVTLWDANTGQMLNQFVANPNYESDSRDVDDLARSWVRDVAFAPDGRMVLAVSGDGTVREWNADSGEIVQEAQIAPLTSAAWSPYTGRLAVWGAASAETSSLIGKTLSIVVPAPSPERLQAIAAACNAPFAVGQSLTADVQADQLSNFIAQVETLPAEAIPPACAADLIAVAEALQSR